MSQPTFQISSRLFVRCLGLTYLFAFVSALGQLKGLIGENGILPMKNIVSIVKQNPNLSFWDWPSIFLIFDSDSSLQTATLLGIISCAFVIVGLLQRWMLWICYVIYLSIVLAGQEFFSYQWDSLLLESGLIGILFTSFSYTDQNHFAIQPSRWVHWALRFLLFKLMFQSGIVKILSNDPQWSGLTALQFHFMSQPIPNPLSWYAHQLPDAFLKICTAFTLAIELILPWFILIPRRFGSWSALVFAPWVLLQTLIFITGNYGFFNILSIIISLILVNDHQWHSILPRRVFWSIYVYPYAGQAIERKSYGGPVVLVLSVFLFLAHTSLQLKKPIPPPLDRIVSEVTKITSRFKISNQYGLFAVMTTSRPEIVVESSPDGISWTPLKFKYKVVSTSHRPKFTLFHMPRLDWQMWFAALGSYERSPWFGGLLLRILESSPEVLSLLDNQIPDVPIKYLKSDLYFYDFSSSQEKNTQGVWWKRVFNKPYVGVATLK